MYTCVCIYVRVCAHVYVHNRVCVDESRGGSDGGEVHWSQILTEFSSLDLGLLQFQPLFLRNHTKTNLLV